MLRKENNESQNRTRVTSLADNSVAFKQSPALDTNGTPETAYNDIPEQLNPPIKVV